MISLKGLFGPSSAYDISLGGSNADYSTLKSSFLNIVAVSLGGVSFSDFQGEPYEDIGLVLYVLLLILFLIILLNLVIARMSVSTSGQYLCMNLLMVCIIKYRRHMNL